MTTPIYNFRIGPEGLFLILSGVGSAILLELYTTDYTAITDWRAYFVGMLPHLLFRTLPGVILAVISGGGFQKPGEPGPLTVTDVDPPATGVG